jgi:hypothetical protein
MKKTKMLMILLCIIGIAFLTADAFAQKPGEGLRKPPFYIKSVEYQKIRGSLYVTKGTPGRHWISPGACSADSKARLPCRAC